MHIIGDVKSAPLQSEEQFLLLKLAQEGNLLAKQKLIVKNYRLVVGIVMQMFTSYDNEIFDEMVSEGVLGLNKAILTFKLETKNKFSSYAVWWIRAYAGKHYRDYSNGIIRLPDNLSYRKLFGKTNIKLYEASGGGGSYLKDESNKVPGGFNWAINLRRVSRINDKGEDLYDNFQRDCSEDPEPIEFDFSDLDEQEKEAITLYYNLGGEDSWHPSLEYVATVMRISRDRLRTILRKAKAKIKLK